MHINILDSIYIVLLLAICKPLCDSLDKNLTVKTKDDIKVPWQQVMHAYHNPCRSKPTMYKTRNKTRDMRALGAVSGWNTPYTHHALYIFSYFCDVRSMST